MITKNIALAGHAGTGKTTLMEALLSDQEPAYIRTGLFPTIPQRK